MKVQAGTWANIGVAWSGPMVVIFIRLLGQGVSPAAAAPLDQGQTVETAQLLSQIQPDPGLVEAWEASILSYRSQGPEPEVETEPTLGAERPSPKGVDRPIPPSLLLTAILGGGERGAAVLSDRICWVGNDLGNGWVLERVNQQARSVTVRHRTGATHTIEFVDEG